MLMAITYPTILNNIIIDIAVFSVSSVPSAIALTITNATTTAVYADMDINADIKFDILGLFTTTAAVMTITFVTAIV